MATQLRTIWWRLSSGLWFIPAVTVLGAILLAMGLVEAESWHEIDLADRFPRLFGAGHDGSRAMLTSIATSMITVAGVVFSVTIVALSLTASQYSPRVLRTFTSDRPTQLVLGVFVGIFVYCLVVLRTIRGGDDIGFVPSIAVMGGLFLSLVGIAFLVYFIHHLAKSIQAASIVSRVVEATLSAVDELFPENLGVPADEEAVESIMEEDGTWTPVLARHTGYIINVDEARLLTFARERGRVLRMESGVGEFVIQGQPLAWLQGNETVTEADEKELDGRYSFDQQRTIEQDAAFGFQQIVDIGSKALSPGINDTSTAALCINRLTQLLVYLARRRIETAFRREEGRLRVIARGPTFARLVDLAYHTLRLDASSKPLTTKHLLSSLEQVAAATSNQGRRDALAMEARDIVEQARLADASRDWQEVIAEGERLMLQLKASVGPLTP